MIERNIYVIEEGLVGIFLEVGPLSRHRIRTASKFDVIGCSAMMDCRCTTTVRAMEKTRVLAFDRQTLHALCISRPEIGYNVFRGIARVVAESLNHTCTLLMGFISSFRIREASCLLE